MGNKIEIEGESGQVYINEHHLVDDGGDILLGLKEEVKEDAKAENEE